MNFFAGIALLFLYLFYLSSYAHDNEHHHQLHSDGHQDVAPLNNDEVQIFGELFTIEQARAQSTIPGINVSSGYMTILNDSDELLRFTGVETNAAAHAEFHAMLMVDDNMTMRQVAVIEIEAHQSFAFKPGGYHLMFIDIKKPLQAGEEIQITLIRDNGERFEVIMPVIQVY